MARNSLAINDEYISRTDLTRLQKFRLRHPELKIREREYTRIYLMDNPEHVSIWRKNNPDKRRAQEKRAQANQRWKLYNITEEQYNNLLVFQNHTCAICKKDKNTKHDWSIDHCHITNKVRGILCSKCNSMIGLAKDNITTLANAIEYLKIHNHEA